MYLPLGTIMLGVAIASASAAATRPASAPASRPAGIDPAQIRAWLAGLDDVDPSERENSRDRLLDLERGDLDTLIAVVQEVRPSDPGPVQDLREIVTHVYLSGEPYATDPRSGFLGIRMPPDRAAERKLKVVVQSRMPGFCGYRALRDGDAIVDIVESPLPQPMEPDAFADSIKLMKPGLLIHLKVLRRGKVLRVAVVLDGRPSGTLQHPEQLEALVAQRRRKAEAYWQARFAPLLNDRSAPRMGGGRG